MYQLSVHKEAIIDVAIQKVFAFITDPHNIPLVLPGLIENTDIPSLPVKARDTFKFKYQLLGVVTEGTVTIDNVESPTTYDFTTSGGADSHWIQRLSNENGKTQFTLEVAYNPPKTWVEKMKVEAVHAINVKSAEAYLYNLKAALELQN